MENGTMVQAKVQFGCAFKQEGNLFSGGMQVPLKYIKYISLSFPLNVYFFPSQTPKPAP